MVEILNELLDTAFKAEVIFCLRADSSVDEVYGETFVVKCHLAESALERAVIVDCLVEDLRIRPDLCL